MIVTLKMPWTTPDTITFKHQVLNRAVRSRVDSEGTHWGGEESW